MKYMSSKHTNLLTLILFWVNAHELRSVDRRVFENFIDLTQIRVKHWPTVSF